MLELMVVLVDVLLLLELMVGLIVLVGKKVGGVTVVPVDVLLLLEMLVGLIVSVGKKVVGVTAGKKMSWGYIGAKATPVALLMGAKEAPVALL